MWIWRVKIENESVDNVGAMKQLTLNSPFCSCRGRWKLTLLLSWCQSESWMEWKIGSGEYEWMTVLTSVTSPSLFLSKLLRKKSDPWTILKKFSLVSIPSSPASLTTRLVSLWVTWESWLQLCWKRIMFYLYSMWLKYAKVIVERNASLAIFVKL